MKKIPTTYIRTMRLILLSLSVFFSSFVCAQTSSVNTDSEQFSSKQDELFIKAYEKKDLSQYNALLTIFLRKFNSLDSNAKKTFIRYYVNAYYNLACIYSLLNKKAGALENLDKAIKGGYYNYQHILKDKDLDNIRSTQQFKKMAESTREVGDYLYILKKGSKYNLKDNRSIPKFTYQKSDNPNLGALRKAFNLDSIAGNGNELSRILNVMHWIHYLIPHDGNHDNPVAKNALNMIAVCKKEDRGLNCRGLATVLNECYLALGFSSRFVTCLPKDSLNVDPDCHVINAVFAPSLQKWLWIDPTNDAYVMNEKGELLSIEEVRERVITGKPLILNPDANWNRRVSKTNENYLYTYMAKNLYILQSNACNEYDSETYGNNKIISTITLLPLEYFKQKPDKKEYFNKEINTTFINYKTNNPTLFWAKPHL